jgi:hypothetical protein
VPFFTHSTVDKKDIDSHSKRELAKALAKVGLLNRKVHNLEEQIRYYKNLVEKYREEDLQAQIKSFRNQYRIIARLYYIWTQAHKENEKEIDRIIVQEVARLLQLEVWGGKYHLGAITDNMNLLFGSVLIHLENDYPKIGPADFNLFCFLAAGFDKYLIIELLGLSGEGLLYTRKCRLKEKLIKLNSSHEVTYLALID